MKNYRLILVLLMFVANSINANENIKKNLIARSGVNDYETSVTFPAGFLVGDYIEFLGVQPISASASGFYEISISYTRGYIAAAATHIAAISHANPDIWRETGCINKNKYVDLQQNFTVDCNTQSGNPRFRVRAINTFGAIDVPLTVYIKIRSINFNGSFIPLNATGNDLTVNKFLPMTNEWELYVGSLTDSGNGASIAIKALANGNVGIGTTTPAEKLSVNGKIRAHEIKVETANWPDYVFEQDYKILGLQELESYIKVNKHLPEMPTAKEVEANGIALGELVKLQQKKIEELTLHLIEKDKQISLLKNESLSTQTLIRQMMEDIQKLKTNQK